MDLLAEKEVHAELVPRTRLNVVDTFTNATSSCQQKRHRQVRGGTGENARSVADRYAPLCALIEIDVVHTDGHIRHDAQPRSRVQKRCIDAIGEHAVKGLG